MGDTTPEARGRQMSTEINVARAVYLDDPWTFLDCPGSVELAGKRRTRCSPATSAVVVCEPEVERALTLGPLFKFLDDHQIPHMVFINKMDTASARVSEVLAALQGVSQRPAGAAASARCRAGMSTRTVTSISSASALTNISRAPLPI